MNQIEDLNNKQVTIEDFKTTFIVLKFEGELFRFNFYKKKEAFLNKKITGKLLLFSTHPLLIDHTENNLETFINSKPSDPDLFIKDIGNTIKETVGSWRNWTDYIENNTGINYQIFKQNIINGRGKLLTAPFSVTEKIEKVCDKHNVKIISFGEKLMYKNKLMMIDDQFIIAEDFKLHA